MLHAEVLGGVGAPVLEGIRRHLEASPGGHKGLETQNLKHHNEAPIFFAITVLYI